MNTAEVVIYRTDWCPYCRRAEALLESKSLQNLKVIDVDVTPGARAEMVQRAGGRTSVPQIFIGDRHVGGCDDLVALERAGRLDPMLAA
ncbi:MAG: glutaredoxin 3 [Burkholderiaceae bacterium]